MDRTLGGPAGRRPSGERDHLFLAGHRRARPETHRHGQSRNDRAVCRRADGAVVADRLADGEITRRFHGSGAWPAAGPPRGRGRRDRGGGENARPRGRARGGADRRGIANGGGHPRPRQPVRARPDDSSRENLLAGCGEKPRRNLPRRLAQPSQPVPGFRRTAGPPARDGFHQRPFRRAPRRR